MTPPSQWVTDKKVGVVCRDIDDSVKTIKMTFYAVLGTFVQHYTRRKSKTMLRRKLLYVVGGRTLKRPVKYKVTSGGGSKRPSGTQNFSI